MIDDGKLRGHKRMLFHLIEAGDITRDLSASSKMNFDFNFLMHLFAIGRERAENWLSENFEYLGVKATLDLRSRYL
jgi:NTE family protein